MGEINMALGCYGKACITAPAKGKETVYLASWVSGMDPPLPKEGKRRYLCITPYGMDFLLWSEFGYWEDDTQARVKKDGVIAWMGEPSFKES